VIYYIRDEEGSLIGLKYNNEIYYYIKNMQEDIIGITDSNNNLLCSYLYDSWGNIISIKDNNGNIIRDTSHIGIINPYRYRSYYYDNETKLYYLNSRYYNPEWWRFINADGIIGANKDILGYNIYGYVGNNPVNNSYDNGHFFKKAWNWVKKKAKQVTNVVKKVVSSAVKQIVSVQKRINIVKNKATTKNSKSKLPVNVTLFDSQSVSSSDNRIINFYSSNNNGEESYGLEIGNEIIKSSMEIDNNSLSLSLGIGNFQGTAIYDMSDGFLNSTISFVGTYTNDYGTATGIKIEIDALTFASVAIFGYVGSKISGVVSNIGKFCLA